MSETRKRWVNFGLGRGVPATHEDEFRDAFKRQKRAAAGEADLAAAAEMDVNSLSKYAKAKHFEKIALSQANIANAHDPPEDANILEFEEVEVIEVQTVSGPRHIWADSLDEWMALGVIVEDEVEGEDEENDDE